MALLLCRRVAPQHLLLFFTFIYEVGLQRFLKKGVTPAPNYGTKRVAAGEADLISKVIKSLYCNLISLILLVTLKWLGINLWPKLYVYATMFDLFKLSVSYKV